MNKKTKRLCRALDLKNDPQLITEYEQYHETIWLEVLEHIKSIGVEDMQIWRIGNRLFMIMEVNDFYDEEKAMLESKNNLINQKWEELMWKYQIRTPWTIQSEKWTDMKKIFDLSEQENKV